eukprot:CAMPEP_0119432052 /NCGR_PEP_ID=MMETSP1335-20130426/47080_1 /TAXON_ID=259385 /ORGANISM="Chrysoculter rhomboideus, Strain RCC1486" /LENGTH=172 /DNA_ID=CAMNT_0007457865 /DNA_START=142 /DNA_END=657 /DNA_ORIENTATION=-
MSGIASWEAMLLMGGLLRVCRVLSLVWCVWSDIAGLVDRPMKSATLRTATAKDVTSTGQPPMGANSLLEAAASRADAERGEYGANLVHVTSMQRAAAHNLHPSRPPPLRGVAAPRLRRTQGEHMQLLRGAASALQPHPWTTWPAARQRSVPIGEALGARQERGSRRWARIAS